MLFRFQCVFNELFQANRQRRNYSGRTLKSSEEPEIILNGSVNPTQLWRSEHLSKLLAVRTRKSFNRWRKNYSTIQTNYGVLIQPSYATLNSAYSWNIFNYLNIQLSISKIFKLKCVKVSNINSQKKVHINKNWGPKTRWPVDIFCC